jgi:hypothetical protein
LKKPCNFPETADLQKGVVEEKKRRELQWKKGQKMLEVVKKELEVRKVVGVRKGGVHGRSEASGSKRKASVEVVMPQKRAWKADEGEEEFTEAEYWANSMAMMQELSTTVKKVGEEVKVGHDMGNPWVTQPLPTLTPAWNQYL